MARIKRPPRWYFSLRSPYSWFAYRELGERYPDVLDAVEWIPYWDPDAETERLLDQDGVKLAYSQMTRAKNFYILQDTRRWSRARGWQMTWPADRDPDWDVAHLPYFPAAAAGLGRDYVAAAYRARWERGEDICDRATIARLAEEIGMDPDEMIAAIDDPVVRKQGAQCLAGAAADGLFGVPFFACGPEKFWGVERAAAFAAMVRGEPVTVVSDVPWQVGAAELAEPAGLGADAGHAGGCG
jgi:2-hydroxychromene-2-carboxylate isomerase